MCETVNNRSNRPKDQTPTEGVVKQSEYMAEWKGMKTSKKQSKKARIKELEERVSELEYENERLKEKAVGMEERGQNLVSLASSVSKKQSKEVELLKSEIGLLKAVVRDVEAANEKWRKEHNELLDRVYNSKAEARELRRELKECRDCSTQDNTNPRIAQLESTVNLWVEGFDELLCWNELLEGALQEDEAGKDKRIEELKSENGRLTAKLKYKRHLYFSSQREFVKLGKRISALKQTIKELAKED